MTERFGGMYPGGPTRKRGESAPERPFRTTPVERMEEAEAVRTVHRRRKARRRRIMWGFLACLVAAGALGLYLGMRTQPSPAEATAEMQESRDRDRMISSEVNRALLELWRMEEVEAGRRR